MRLTEAFAPLVDLLYPPRCPLCGEGIGAQTGLCLSCWGELVIPGEPACAACQRPFGEGGPEEDAICAACMADPPGHDGMSAGTLYNDAARQLVLSYKHGRKIALAPMLARLIAARLPELEGEWVAVPVPLHRWRLWQRGFNQSALLARELAGMRNLGLCLDGLVRSRATPALGGLGKRERAETLKGAIKVAPRQAGRLKGGQILLVDDVMTSGATTGACQDALRKAGAAKVRIACFSRVLDEALADSKTPGGSSPRAFA